MASYWNIPVLTAGGFGSKFANKSIYSTLTRLIFSLDKMSQFIIAILKHFEWQNIALIVNVNNKLNVDVAASIDSEFTKHNLNSHFMNRSYEIIWNEFHFDGDKNDTENFKRMLLSASKRSRGKNFCYPIKIN